MQLTVLGTHEGRTRGAAAGAGHGPKKKVSQDSRSRFCDISLTPGQELRPGPNLSAMRLLDTELLQVISIREDDIPPYAILSHTWGPDEVSLQDIVDFRLSSFSLTEALGTNPSLNKIVNSAKLAASEGYQWIWIDTCCIDKTSSAELSEAINSMYRWYENAGVCYVYIEDATRDQQDLQSHLSNQQGQPDTDAETEAFLFLRNTRWATRGWTLQELVASKTIRFFNNEWVFMGEKNDPPFCRALSRVTGIEVGVLSQHITVAEISVANRMKWASKRQTTRPEDMAYSLMGLFGVNMPLLYGEGGVRAFLRLQEQILQDTDDQSIFAWQLKSEDEGGLESMHGLLATSPTYFEDVRSIYLIPTGFQSAGSIPWTMTNKGLNIQLFIRAEVDSSEERYLAILDCFHHYGDLNHSEAADGSSDGAQAYSPAIHLRRLWGDQYTRIRAHLCESVGDRDRHDGCHETVFAKQSPAPPLPKLGLFDYPRLRQSLHGWRLRQVFPSDCWNEETGTFRLSLSRARGIQGMFRFTRQHDIHQAITTGKYGDEGLDIVIVLHRTARAELEAACFPRPEQGNTVEEAYYRLNRIWTMASRDEQDFLFGEHQERIMVVPEMMKAMRAGRGQYLINLRERYELETDVSGMPAQLLAVFDDRRSVRKQQASLERDKHITELDGEPLHGVSLARAKAMILKSMKARSVQPRVNLVRMEDDLRTLLRPLLPWSVTDSNDFRIRMENGAKDATRITSMNPRLVELGQAIIDEDVPTLLSLLESLETSEITGPLSSFEGLGATHLACFSTDPRVASALIEKGVDPLIETETGLNSIHLASILGKSRLIGLAMRLAPQTQIVEDAEDFAPSYAKAVSVFRPFFGAEAQLQDTALHLAAVHCCAEDFANILEEILKATRIPISRWTSAELTQEREYLVCLRNGLGETVLHRAAAAANVDVVTLICEIAPGAVSRVDSMSRSTLWHATYGGNPDIVRLIAQACSNLIIVPYLHLCDENGVSPLHVACWKGHGECVRELLKLGATSLCMTQELGLTPLHYAALFGHANCLSIMADGVWRGTRQLGEFNTVIDMKARKGSLELFAPIHLAAANGWVECARVLAVNGASTSTTTTFYYVSKERPDASVKGLVEVPPSTPSKIAAREGYDTIAGLLDISSDLDQSLATGQPNIMDSKSLLEDWNRQILLSTPRSIEN